jgi:ParB-like chromosome segregation protein Spo0J
MTPPKYASLKVAAESKIEGVKKETIFQVDPFIVEVEPGFNRPLSRDHIESIKMSLRSGAELDPIWVRVHRTADTSRIVMVDGEHRLWAVRELVEDFRAGREGGREIPLMSAKEFKGSDADRIAHLLTSAQGLSIAPLDLGIQYKRLLSLHWTRQQIAERVGKSITHVDECIMLAEANTDVQQAVRKDEVSASLAAEILREHGDDAGKVIQQELVKAKSSGKSKVTRAGMKGRAMPRKLTERVTESFGVFAERITLPPSLPDLSNLPPETEVEVQVKIPASMLAELKAAHEELLKHRAKAAAQQERNEPAPEAGNADDNKAGE